MVVQKWAGHALNGHFAADSSVSRRWNRPRSLLHAYNTPTISNSDAQVLTELTYPCCSQNLRTNVVRRTRASVWLSTLTLGPDENGE